MTPRVFTKTALFLCVAAATMFGKAALAPAVNDQDFSNFWGNVTGTGEGTDTFGALNFMLRPTDQRGCVNSHDFDHLFQMGSAGGSAWNMYVPRGPNLDQRRALPNVRELVRELWPKYEGLLGGSPGNRGNPVRVVLMPDSIHPMPNHYVPVWDYVAYAAARCPNSADSVYLFVPPAFYRYLGSGRGYAREYAGNSYEVAVGLFNAFQIRQAVGGAIHSPYRTWWSYGAAEWAAQSAMGVRRSAGAEAVAWTYPLAPLDETFRYWNPTELPALPSGVDEDELRAAVNVAALRPRVIGAKFMQYLAGAFGVIPGQEFTSTAEQQEFGRFLSQTFDGLPTNLSTSGANAAAVRRDIVRIDGAIGAGLRTARTRRPSLPDGLGSAYANFAVGHMIGSEPRPISWEQDSFGREGLFFAWASRPIPAPVGRTDVLLNAPHGLGSDVIQIQRPAESVHQILISVEGRLPDEGRLLMQSGTQGFIDISENARSPEGSDRGLDGTTPSGDLMPNRTFRYCLSNDRTLEQFRWPGRLSMLLANASPNGPEARGVDIRIRIDAKRDACSTTGVFDPNDPGGRYLKPDGSGEKCPEPTVEADVNVCVLTDAPREDPESVPQPPPPRDLNNARAPIPPTPSTILGGGNGIDCEQNRADRARARRAGRPRTSSERLVDRACDELMGPMGRRRS